MCRVIHFLVCLPLVILPGLCSAQLFGPVQALDAPGFNLEPDLVVGDFDNDGDSDIFIDLGFSDFDYLLLNNGENQFVIGDSISSSTGVAPTFDINGDEVDDILQNTRWLSYVNGSFVETNIPTGVNGVSGFPHDGIADLDNDGLVDLLRFKENTGTTSIIRALYNEGEGNFANSVALTQEIGFDFFNPEVITADFDQDGWTDLLIHGRAIVAQNFIDSSRIFFNQNDTAYVQYDLPSSRDRLVIDIDGDTDLDILARQGDDLVILSNDAGSFSNQGTIEMPLRTGAQVVNLDNQGRAEVFMAGGEDPSISFIQYNEEDQWDNRIDLYDDDIYSSVIADLDQDGDLDIIFSERQFGGSYRLFWFENQTVISTTTSLTLQNEIVDFYPNPATDILNFELDGDIAIQFIGILDQLGRIVGRYPVSTNRASIDIRALLPGAYTFQCFGEGNVLIATGKFLK